MNASHSSPACSSRIAGRQLAAGGSPDPVSEPSAALHSNASIRVLVACEFSAVVRDAFRARGFDAWSCDLLPTERDPRWHIQGDAIEAAYGQPWDLLIAHPPCTHLAVSGARWFKDKLAEQAEALGFVRLLLEAPVAHIVLENPVSIISSRIRKPEQIIQPWQYGHGETKATCLWLKNLPTLRPTNIVEGREARVHRMPPGPDRWKERSRTYAGIAQAMADQWGDYLISNANIRRGPIAPAGRHVSPFVTPSCETHENTYASERTQCLAPATSKF